MAVSRSGSSRLREINTVSVAAARNTPIRIRIRCIEDRFDISQLKVGLLYTCNAISV
jgi:hypothetical protein